MQATAKSLGIDRLSLAECILLVEEIWAASLMYTTVYRDVRRVLTRRFP